MIAAWIKTLLSPTPGCQCETCKAIRARHWAIKKL